MIEAASAVTTVHLLLYSLIILFIRCTRDNWRKSRRRAFCVILPFPNADTLYLVLPRLH